MEALPGSINHVFGPVTLHDCKCKLSLAGTDGASNQDVGLTSATGLNGLPRMRTALLNLRVALPGAQHPIQSYGQLVRDSHFGYAVMLVQGQTKILPVPTHVRTLRLDRSLDQQPTSSVLPCL